MAGAGGQGQGPGRLGSTCRGRAGAEGVPKGKLRSGAAGRCAHLPFCTWGRGRSCSGGMWAWGASLLSWSFPLPGGPHFRASRGILGSPGPRPARTPQPHAERALDRPCADRTLTP